MNWWISVRSSSSPYSLPTRYGLRRLAAIHVPVVLACLRLGVWGAVDVERWARFLISRFSPSRAAPLAGSAGCRRRNRDCLLQERLRGPAHERYGVVPREASDVDEPNDRFDPDGGADAEHELAKLFI